MRHVVGCLLLAACALAGSPTDAQVAADLSLQVQVEPPGPLIAGTEARITLTIENLGPDEATFVGGISSGYPFLFGGYFDLYPNVPLLCQVDYDDFVNAPGKPSTLVAGVHFGTLAPGATKQCTLGLFVYAESRGPYELSFRADAFTPDNNEANNTVILGLVFQESPPRTIPATATWASLALVGLLVLGGALRGARRA